MYMYICMSIYTYTFSGGNGPNESNQESSASHHPNINSKRRSWSVVGDPEEPLKGNSSQPHGVARALISKFMFFQRCSKKQVEFFMLKKNTSRPNHQIINYFMSYTMTLPHFCGSYGHWCWVPSRWKSTSWSRSWSWSRPSCIQHRAVGQSNLSGPSAKRRGCLSDAFGFHPAE